MSNLLTISYGDTSDGPDMLEDVLRIMTEAGAVLEIESVQLGYEMERLEFVDGFDNEGLNKIRRAGVLLKAPTVKDLSGALKAGLGKTAVVFEGAEPTTKALLQAAIEMLRHLGQAEIAERIAYAAARAKNSKNFTAKVIKNL